VLAAFPQAAAPPGRPIEVPIAADAPLHREWALVIDSPGCAVCLAAWEVPEQAAVPDGQRLFEALWTVDPDLVREAGRVLLRTAIASGGPLPEDAEELLDGVPPGGTDTIDRLTSLTNRMIGYMARGNQLRG
jgi:hypothetical protein